MMSIEQADKVHWELETDVVVVGAGGCGMVAALAAAQAGAQVLLVEKTARISGSTSLSTSMIPAAGTRFQKLAGIDDTPEIMAQDILSKNEHSSDAAMTRCLCAHSAGLVEWLVDYAGVKLHLPTDFLYSGHSRHRMHTTDHRTGAELVEQLAAAVRRTPSIELAFNAPIRSLVADDNGGVAGVVVETEQLERVKARKTILATSGFGANKEMVAHYCPDIAGALYFGGEGNTGEGILLGMEMGAAVENMDAYQGHGSVAFPHGMLVTWVVLVNGGFMVNKEGRRFGDEMLGYSGFAVYVNRQTDSIGFDIYDERIHKSVMPFADYQDCINAQAMKHSDTIEGLADALHLPAAALRKTLEDYNAAVDRGRDEFGRTELARLNPPYYGIQVTGALFHTQGGLKVDARARVLRPDGSAISNLYAGGDTAVGVSGRGANGYLAGNGLLAALVLGKLAGDDAGRACKNQT